MASSCLILRRPPRRALDLALTLSGGSYSESAHAAGEERFETADPFAISFSSAELTAEGP